MPFALPRKAARRSRPTARSLRQARINPLRGQRCAMRSISAVNNSSMGCWRWWTSRCRFAIRRRCSAARYRDRSTSMRTNIVSATMPSPPPIGARAIPCSRSGRISVCTIRASAGLSGHVVTCRQKTGAELERTTVGESTVAIPPSEWEGVVRDALTQGILRGSNVSLDREIRSRTQKASSHTHSAHCLCLVEAKLVAIGNSEVHSTDLKDVSGSLAGLFLPRKNLGYRRDSSRMTSCSPPVR